MHVHYSLQWTGSGWFVCCLILCCRTTWGTIASEPERAFAMHEIGSLHGGIIWLTRWICWYQAKKRAPLHTEHPGDLTKPCFVISSCLSTTLFSCVRSRKASGVCPGRPSHGKLAPWFSRMAWTSSFASVGCAQVRPSPAPPILDEKSVPPVHTLPMSTFWSLDRQLGSRIDDRYR